MPRPARLPRMLTLLASAAMAQAPGLGVGSVAPALQVSRWVKGKASLEPGKVTVVEFWATWCGPCRKSIPHLTELAHKYKDKVAFVGVDILEEGEDIEKRVDAFVKDMGDRMDYPVARDTPDGAMNRTWMRASGRDGIPSAFIVDAKGAIAWVGHPMSKLEEALDAVLAGKHDPVAAAKEDEAERARTRARREKREAEDKVIEEVDKALREAGKAKDWAKILELADQGAAKVPERKGAFSPDRFRALLHTDEAKAQALLDTEKASAKPNLATFAIVAAEEEGLAPRWYAFAAEVLEKGIPSMPDASFLLPSLAKAYAGLGRSAEALASYERYAAWARTQKGLRPELMQDIEKGLKAYRALNKPARTRR